MHKLSTGVCAECFARYLKHAFRYRDSSLVQREVFALFHYSVEIRDLILLAKVQCNYAALETIVNLACAHPFVRTLLDWTDVIVPMPSSFWGRIRGRYDIVAHICSKLSRTYKKELLPLRVPIYWRVSKRAMTKDIARKSETVIQKTIFASQADSRRYLLVDDVSSTGFTLNEAARLLNVSNHKALVIAGTEHE
ncbi:MAG: ComF family protein [Oligoflexales bacterium]